MSEYQKKLEDPRWKEKRLEILERDKKCCQSCGKSKKVLQVHHRLYISGVEPWDYPDKYLVTLCAGCHWFETKRRGVFEGMIIDSFKKFFLTDDLITISTALNIVYRQKENRKISSKDLTKIITHVITDELCQDLLLKKFKYDDQRVPVSTLNLDESIKIYEEVYGDD